VADSDSGIRPDCNLAPSIVLRGGLRIKRLVCRLRPGTAAAGRPGGPSAMRSGAALRPSGQVRDGVVERSTEVVCAHLIEPQGDRVRCRPRGDPRGVPLDPDISSRMYPRRGGSPRGSAPKGSAGHRGRFGPREHSGIRSGGVVMQSSRRVMSYRMLTLVTSVHCAWAGLPPASSRSRPARSSSRSACRMPPAPRTPPAVARKGKQRQRERRTPGRAARGEPSATSASFCISQHFGDEPERSTRVDSDACLASPVGCAPCAPAA